MLLLAGVGSFLLPVDGEQEEMRGTRFAGMEQTAPCGTAA